MAVDSDRSTPWLPAMDSAMQVPARPSRRLGRVAVEAEDLDPPVHGGLDNRLHVVEVRLAQVDGAQARHGAGARDVVAAAPAEMHGASAEGGEDALVVGADARAFAFQAVSIITT